MSAPAAPATNSLPARARAIPPAATPVMAAWLGSSSFSVATVSHAVIGNSQVAPSASVGRASPPVA